MSSATPRDAESRHTSASDAHPIRPIDFNGASRSNIPPILPTDSTSTSEIGPSRSSSVPIQVAVPVNGDEQNSEEIVVVGGAIATGAGSNQHQPINDAKKSVSAGQSSKAVAPEKRSHSEMETSLNVSIEKCVICYEELDNSGEHRIVCLKCGHVFGESCITQWLAVKQDAVPCCPTCKMRARSRDIRVLYMEGMRVRDKTTEQALRGDLERSKKAEEKARRETAAMEGRCTMLSSDLNGAKRRISDLLSTKEALTKQLERKLPAIASNSRQEQRPLYRLQLSRKLKCASSTCGNRVMQVDSVNARLAIAGPYPTGGFHLSHGIRYVDTVSFQSMKAVALHSAEIKDISVSAMQNGLVLTVGMDGKMCICSPQTNNAIHTSDLGMPAFCCRWNLKDHWYGYLGMRNGEVRCMDMRKLSAPVFSSSPGGDGCLLGPPMITSMEFLGGSHGARVSNPSLLIVQGSRIWTLEGHCNLTLAAAHVRPILYMGVTGRPRVGGTQCLFPVRLPIGCGGYLTGKQKWWGPAPTPFPPSTLATPLGL